MESTASIETLEATPVVALESEAQNLNEAPQTVPEISAPVDTNGQINVKEQPQPVALSSSSTRTLTSPLLLDHFNFGVTLGTGSFGRVKIAVHKDTGTIWAVKMLKKSEIIRLQQVEHMISEKKILSTLDHPFIVRLAGTFQDEKYLYMVLEYVVGGEFFTHLRKAGRFDTNSSKFYTAQICVSFEYMHSSDYIYRDLKPENLLLDKEGYLKITDFGFAKRVPFKTYTLCGTPEYIAPEVLLNKGHGKGVDWWTLGILLFEMMAGQPPFVDDDPMGIYQQILAGKISFPKFFDRNAKSLVKKLLVADLTKRYGCLKAGAEDIKKHKFLNGYDWTSLLNRKLNAPIIPIVNGENDTSNFDHYPEENEEPPIPNYGHNPDPFLEF